jgi:hypothetical protein
MVYSVLVSDAESNDMKDYLRGDNIKRERKQSLSVSMQCRCIRPEGLRNVTNMLPNTVNISAEIIIPNLP